MLENVEKRVFFTITRVFAWVVILPALVALIFGGVKLGISYFSGHKAPVITQEEVKAELERMENPWNAPKAPEPKKKGKADEWKHEAQLQELLDVLGDQVDRFKARQIIQEMVMKHDPKDRTAYMKGLISVVNQTTKEKRLQAIDAYESLWNMAALSRDADEMATKGERAVQVYLLIASFAVVALFSLILILLAIEKNTRKEL